MKYVHFEHAGDIHFIIRIWAPSIMFALGIKTNQYTSMKERWAVRLFIEHWSKITPESWASKV